MILPVCMNVEWVNSDKHYLTKNTRGAPAPASNSTTLKILRTRYYTKNTQYEKSRLD